MLTLYTTHLRHLSPFLSHFPNTAVTLVQYKTSRGAGKLGKTAQLWLTYDDSVWSLLRLHRAIKENDQQRYIASMRNVCSLLFSADHLNCARNLTFHYRQLLNLEQSNPGAVDLMRANGLSVGRSTVPASRCALDLTIKQTMNRAAKTPGGIVGFGRKLLQMVRHTPHTHTRASYIQVTLSRAHMFSECDDAHRSTRPSELNSSERNVERVLEAFRQFQNPFDTGAKHQASLICISSGQPANDDVAADVVQYVNVACLADRNVKFQNPMKKVRLKTFQSAAAVKVLKKSQKKSIHVKAERNLVGQLLMCSQQHDISLRKLFQYQLGLIPWPIATADGGMVKTDKSQLKRRVSQQSRCCQNGSHSRRS